MSTEMNRKIRVLHVFKAALPDSVGGVEKVIDQLCQSSKEEGIQASVFALSDAPASEPVCINGYQVFQERCNFSLASTSFSVSAFSSFSKLARKSDIIHYHFPWPFMDILHFVCRINKPTVLTYHSDIIKQKLLLKLYKPLMHRFFHRVDSIVSTSPNYFATSDTLKLFREKVEVIPIGLDKSLYAQQSVDCLNVWKKKFKGKFFLFVGALRYYKGLNILLEAMRGTDFEVVIVGVGKLETELKKQAKRLGLKNVHFFGQASEEDKLALLQLCYAFVFPSQLRSEAFGVALLESAMFGKAMISSEIGTGTSFININGETGIVVPPDAPKSLREAMQYLIDHPEKTDEFGKNSEKRYRQYFTADKQIQAYSKIYRKILAQEFRFKTDTL